MIRRSAGLFSDMAMASDSAATGWEEFNAKPQRSRRDAKIGGVRPVPSNSALEAVCSQFIQNRMRIGQYPVPEQCLLVGQEK